MMKTPKGSPGAPGVDRIARVLAVLALVVSLGGLALDWVQANQQEAYRRVTTRPLLGINRIFTPTEGFGCVGIYLQNHGNGVANIVGGDVSYGSTSLEDKDGPFAGMADLIHFQSGDLFPTIRRMGPRLAGVVEPGARLLLLGIDVAEYTPERGAALERYIRGMGIRLEYQSLYQDEILTATLDPDAD